MEWDDFVVLSEGSRTRAYLQEIIQCKKGKVHPDQRTEKWHININQEGLSDMLPKGVLAPQTRSDAYDSINTYIAESKAKREQMSAAQRFFRPYEQEIHRLRILTAQREARQSSTITNPLAQRVTAFALQTSKGVPLPQSVHAMATRLLPLAHRATTDLGLMTLCFSTLLQDKVSIITRQPSLDEQVPSHLFPPLGQAILGKDLALHGQHRPETETLFVRIGPLSKHKRRAYLPGQDKAIILHWLQEYFTPYSCDMRWTLLEKQSDNDFKLGVDSYLGYSTSLH